jgi:hypothetical protein
MRMRILWVEHVLAVYKVLIDGVCGRNPSRRDNSDLTELTILH